MRNGFELLRTRPIEERFEVNNLEIDYQVCFPPLFKVFLETFALPLKPSKEFIAFYKDQEVGFDDFMKSIDLSLRVYKEEESYSNYSMLPFASSGIHSGGVCVCLNGENMDKIFVNDEVIDGKFRLIAENVFEFVRALKEVADGDDPAIYI